MDCAGAGQQSFPFGQQPHARGDICKEYKVVLIGDGGTGKTTYITRIIDGNFEHKYIATNGVVVRDVVLNTNKGYKIKFNVWDVAGQDKYSIMGDGYYESADAVIIFFDLGTNITFTNVAGVWMRKLMTLFGKSTERGKEGKCKIPVVVCGNKVDTLSRADRGPMHEKRRKYRDMIRRSIAIDYIEMSAKSNYNFDLPFKVLASALTGDNNIVFTFDARITPASITLTPEIEQESRKVMQEMSSIDMSSIDMHHDEVL